MKLDITDKNLITDPANNYEKRRAWVIYQLKLRGQTLASIARQASPSVTKQQTQKAMSSPYPRMEKLIANALGLKPQELFPERYDAYGLPNRRMGRPKKFPSATPENNTYTRARNVQDGEAA